jgi:hypothetical protein
MSKSTVDPGNVVGEKSPAASPQAEQHVMSLIDNPEHLRLRAADMRGRADRAMYPETRQGLLRIAGDYDVLAARAEQRLAGLRKLAEADAQHADAATSADQDPNRSEPDLSVL